MIEQRSNPPAPQQHSGSRLLGTIHSLKFEIEYEPIFASAAIFDLKTRKKISENFYFDLNTETIKGMLRTHVAFQDISTLSRSAIFSVTYPNPDLYLVIRVSKLFNCGWRDPSTDNILTIVYNFCAFSAGKSINCWRNFGRHRAVRQRR